MELDTRGYGGEVVLNVIINLRHRGRSGGIEIEGCKSGGVEEWGR